MRRVLIFSALMFIAFSAFSIASKNDILLNKKIIFNNSAEGIDDPHKTTELVGYISADILESSGTIPFTVRLNFSITGQTGSEVLEVDFGDGTIYQGQQEEYTYTEAGTYQISVTVFERIVDTDQADKEFDSRNRTLIIGSVKVESPFGADFTQDKVIGNAPLEVQFTDQSGQNPESWIWDFGDGLRSNQQNPTHLYTDEGIYTVSLISRREQLEETVTKKDLVTVLEEFNTDFTQDITEGEKPLTVEFEDLTTGQPDTWSWDFGDGNTSMEQNPTHVFENSGTFTVRLTASNPYSMETKVYDRLIVVKQTTGIENEITEMIEVGAHNTIRFNGDFIGLAKIIKYDGRVMLDNKAINPGDIIDMNSMEAGAYFILIFDGNNYGIKKLIISD